MKFRSCCGAAMALALIAGIAVAAEPANKHETVAPVAAAEGMRVYRDPETGKLVSQPITEEQRRAAQNDAEFSKPSRAVEGVASDGSPMMILNGDHELALSVQVDADGTRHPVCTDAAHGTLPTHTHAAAPVARDVR